MLVAENEMRRTPILSASVYGCIERVSPVEFGCFPPDNTPAAIGWQRPHFGVFLDLFERNEGLNIHVKMKTTREASVRHDRRAAKVSAIGAAARCGGSGVTAECLESRVLL